MSNGVKERKACSLLASFSLPLSISVSLPLLLFSLTFSLFSFLVSLPVHLFSHFLFIPLIQAILFAFLHFPLFLLTFFLSLCCDSEPTIQPYMVLQHHTHKVKYTRTHRNMLTDRAVSCSLCWSVTRLHST